MGDQASAETTQDKVELLYKYYGILADSGENMSKHADIYAEIVKATKGDSKEKKLACQFIPRFVVHFPELANDAINAHFDLCEDNDLSIRKQAIRELPSFCRQCTEYTRRVADILSQLLQAAEATELIVVRSSLISLFNIDPKATLYGIFNQIKNGEDRVREKCIEFVNTRVRDLPQQIFTDDVQDIFVSELKTVIQDANSDEIPIFFDLLLWTKLGKTTVGRKQILEELIKQLKDEQVFNTDDYVKFIVDRFLAFGKAAKGVFSNEISSNEFLEFFFWEIAPKFHLVNGSNEGSGNALEVLKLLAEIACHVKDLENTKGQIDAVFSLLLGYLPLPSEGCGVPQQQFQFSYVECLLTTVHHILRDNPGYLNDDKDKLKNLRERLQFFARTSQVYVKTLEETIKNNKKDDQDNMDTRIKVIALKTISNINILIKDFFHNPPVYKSNIKPSWLSVNKQSQKRKLPVVLVGVEKNVHKEPVETKKNKSSRSFHLGIYQPPNGKYSSNLFAPR